MKIKLPVKLIFKNRKLKLKCVNKGTYENKGLIVKTKKSFENQDNEEDIGRSFYFIFFIVTAKQPDFSNRYLMKMFSKNLWRRVKHNF